MKPGRVIVTIGRPIPAQEYESLSVDGFRDMVQERISRLAKEYY